ncbi:hypothetical protein [uncultured Cardiobacterium sp.]|uniref:hypothetical protein n=1 Tax=uncultured Cardiobacterium sp. TaxID=417619 RepID=UPI0026132253|nr:hypothetical protein [uncultured Cardiobacterium sp.]
MRRARAFGGSVCTAVPLNHSERAARRDKIPANRREMTRKTACADFRALPGSAQKTVRTL